MNTMEIRHKAIEIIYHLQKSSNIFELIDTKSTHVGILCATIGNWLKLSQTDIYHLACAGLLHDIGIMSHSDSDHAKKGFEVLAGKNEFDCSVLLAVLFHHELYDGSGFPFGLKGSEIHLFAKILAIADFYHNKSHGQTFLTEYQKYKFLKELSLEGQYLYDPEIWEIFVRNMKSHFKEYRSISKDRDSILTGRA
ncbi:hypothetical protein BHU72_05735 [Desulfuribacillus stibiiarsenatis]|uniref:HD-GYP domain-containing protein n=1 Tax=Desulfuribacillus stibiiarsenatis TaxID=1390249 RepID=A0A1E5L4S1_9FIRM|nr:HD domain-containing phosphohydrolase [Desulfuribacillus stibiiarsenatis]OEH85111.1 hypothetical protein BHU72_05735 [Desulfuribacillus stibiiarsenatis]